MRHLFQDHLGVYENSLGILHYDPNHKYWKDGLYYRHLAKGIFSPSFKCNLVIETLLPFHIRNGRVPFTFPPDPATKEVESEF